MASRTIIISSVLVLFTLYCDDPNNSGETGLKATHCYLEAEVEMDLDQDRIVANDATSAAQECIDENDLYPTNTWDSEEGSFSLPCALYKYRVQETNCANYTLNGNTIYANRTFFSFTTKVFSDLNTSIADFTLPDVENVVHTPEPVATVILEEEPGSLDQCEFATFQFEYDLNFADRRLTYSYKHYAPKIFYNEEKWVQICIGPE